MNFAGLSWIFPWIFLLVQGIAGNLPPIFKDDLTNHVLNENLPVGSIVYTLKGHDPENSTVRYGILGTDFFSVNPTTGEVKLEKPLDREVSDVIHLTVTLEDEIEKLPDETNHVNGGENNVVSVPVSVIIVDSNDNPPVFLEVPYDVTIAEDTKPGSTIFWGIHVKDVDLLGEPLQVFCSASGQYPDPCSKFSFVENVTSQQQYHGIVVLRDTLDYSKRQLYQLTLVATDGDHNTTTVLEVKVADVQNTPPIFINSLVGVVQENAEIGSLVMTVQAKDGDTGHPRNINYELVTNPLDYFLLDPKSGELRTGKKLDKEALKDSTGVLTLKIRAYEIANGTRLEDPSTETIAEATITIKDVNDEPPRFEPREDSVEIPENLQVNTPLPKLNMTVSDPDVGNNSIFSLRLVDVSGVFAVEPTMVRGSSSVSIRVANGTLDYENPNQRKFFILVVAEETHTSPKLSSTATITVSITDINDNAPYFEKKDAQTGLFTATVSETAPPGELITSIVAKDEDSGSYGVNGIVYQLEGNGAEKFSVHPKTGVIGVAQCETPGKAPCLDFESRSVYDLTYRATDDEGKGLSNEVSLRILLTDSNDNEPVFNIPHYRTAIDEGANKFQQPFKIFAHDADTTSEIEYYILEGNIKNLFSIDQNSGEITVTDKRGLDMTNVTTGVINLIVQATDGKFSTNATVSITVNDVNNNAPVFEQSDYDTRVSEDTKEGAIIATVSAHDSDSGSNADIKYHIQKGAFDDFIIDEITGAIRVVKKLDYDNHRNYSIEIIAYDGGSPSLTGTTTLQVEVVNNNDKHPYFDPITQRESVPESAKIGFVVHTLRAEDHEVGRENALTYAITEPITAIDNNGKLVNHTEEFKEFFKVDQQTGEVFVAKELRRDIASVVTLTVLVKDESAPTLQQGKGKLIITITDVNDHPPTFAQPWTRENPRYDLNVVEGLNENTLIATITAMDEDSNIAYYKIDPESPFFEIGTTSGKVTLKKEIDYEQDKILNFTVWAYDSGIPQLNASAFVVVNVINVNDNAPVFNQSEYRASIPENSRPGTYIISVGAKDADDGMFGQVTYSLTGEHADDFTIGDKSGDLRVSNSEILDREEVPEIIVQVAAKDGASADSEKIVSVPVYITIMDINDNSPVFEKNNYAAEIVENIELNPPAKITKVVANDPDAGEFGRVNYKIISGNVQDVFRIDVETGIIYPQKSLIGQQKHYHLVIEGKDGGGRSDKTSVEIKVQSVNQHKPTFIIPSAFNATVEIPEIYGKSVPDDYVVMRVKAEDADTGDNGKITYHFKVNDSDVQETDEFSIQKDTGEITTKILLDRENKSRFELLLVAKDHGTPTHYETLRLLTILLTDQNDNSPEFQKDRYDFSVLENQDVGILIGQVEATDHDIDHNARIYYYIELGNEDSSFRIDRTTGKIYSNIIFDREIQDQYILYIKATDQPGYYPTKKDRRHRDILERDPSVAHVRIEILDDNDNPPKFEKTEYHAGIKSSAAVNELIVQIAAEDPDKDLNGTIQYYIAASNLYKSGSLRSSGSIVPSPFNITAEGKIVTAAYMAEYNQDKFILDVVAREVAPPGREARARVHVWVIEPYQSIRVILSRPPEEINRERDEIVAELSNATQNLVVVDDIRYYIDKAGHVHRDWTDMCLHVVDNMTQNIIDVAQVLKIIDAKYDYLKDYYTGFAIENVVPYMEDSKEDKFDSALAALIALVIVLFVGCITFIVVCCCLKNWVLALPANDDLKKKDALIKKAILEELNTTENPLWMEQKLKLYEEQELTMQVFTDPDNTGTLRRNSAGEISQGDNTYATIQHPNRRNSNLNGISDDIGDYETLTGAHRQPHSNNSSMRGVPQPQHLYEAALGFQGSTFQVPLPPTPPAHEHRSHVSPEFVAELL